ncbi:hypothetical protein, partial [Xanthomonas translucens]|uniref:hypothetical protein n=1 Tax=Xanthomonas campestris pv. translucens TaxID=343 RepID=UPI001C401252
MKATPDRALFETEPGVHKPARGTAQPGGNADNTDPLRGARGPALPPHGPERSPRCDPRPSSDRAQPPFRRPASCLRAPCLQPLPTAASAAGVLRAPADRHGRAWS